MSDDSTKLHSPKLSPWIAKRLEKNQPLLTPAEQRKLTIRFEALLARIAKPNQDPTYRHAERLEVIEQLLSLRIAPTLADCLFSCVRANEAERGSVLALFTGEVEDQDALHLSDLEDWFNRHHGDEA